MRVTGSILAACAMSGMIVEASRTVYVVQTSNSTGDRLAPQASRSLGTVQYGSLPHGPEDGAVVTVNSSEIFQEILGFGGAITESSTWVYNQLNAAGKQELLGLLYGKGSLGYSMARLPMGACDFSLGTNSYAEFDGDLNLTEFNIEHDVRMGRIGFIQDAIAAREAAFPNSSETGIKLLGSPWSAPWWMKSNRAMVCSVWMYLIGCELAADPAIRASYAQYFVKYVDAMKAHGLDIWAVTPQNEPETENLLTYESMVFTPATERDWVKDHLGPAMKAAHPEVNIFQYDHNKGHLPTWVDTVLGDPDAAQYLAGTAYHWYDGSHFDNVLAAHNKYPDKMLLSTESTVAINTFTETGGLWKDAEKYLGEIIGDLNAFTVGFIDWNVALSVAGTPLHIGPIISYDLFGSSAMIMVDTDHQKIIPQFFYYYMGQISKFVPPGSRRVGCTMQGASNETLVVSAFLTPVGGGDPAGAGLLPAGVGKKQQVVVVAMNTADTAQNYTLVDHDQTATLELPPHSAHTLVYDPSP